MSGFSYEKQKNVQYINSQANCFFSSRLRVSSLASICRARHQPWKFRTRRLSGCTVDRNLCMAKFMCSRALLGSSPCAASTALLASQASRTLSRNLRDKTSGHFPSENQSPLRVKYKLKKKRGVRALRLPVFRGAFVRELLNSPNQFNHSPSFEVTENGQFLSDCAGFKIAGTKRKLKKQAKEEIERDKERKKERERERERKRERGGERERERERARERERKEAKQAKPGSSNPLTHIHLRERPPAHKHPNTHTHTQTTNAPTPMHTHTHKHATHTRCHAHRNVRKSQKERGKSTNIYKHTHTQTHTNTYQRTSERVCRQSRFQTHTHTHTE